MKKILSKAEWEGEFDGLIFTGCAIREGNMAYIMARPDITEEEFQSDDEASVPTFIYSIYELDEEDDLIVGGLEFNTIIRPKIGVSLIPVSQGLLLSNEINGLVVPIGGGQTTWPVECSTMNTFPLAQRLREIDGYTWLAGRRRHIYKRVDWEKWEAVNTGIEDISVTHEDFSDVGFNDIDGFSGSDIYAVGGKGDIWHYDGESWSRCGFPSNERLELVCCAGDGQVYVGTHRGIWRGREHNWEKICEFELPNMANDLRWFNDRLWLSYDYGLFMWDGKELSDEIEYQGEILPLSGHMDACENFLLIASLYSVWTFDGTDWTEIIHPY